MKKIIILLLLMVMVIGSGYGLDWIDSTFAIELGYAPNYSSINKVDNILTVYNTEDSAYVLFEMEILLFKYIFLGGGVKTWIQGTGKYNNFHPFQSDYMFNGGFRLGSLDIGYQRMCLHPTRPIDWHYDMSNTADGSYNEFYVRYEVKY